jgi:hypothetical protein
VQPALHASPKSRITPITDRAGRFTYHIFPGTGVKGDLQYPVLPAWFLLLPGPDIFVPATGMPGDGPEAGDPGMFGWPESPDPAPIRDRTPEYSFSIHLFIVSPVKYAPSHDVNRKEDTDHSRQAEQDWNRRKESR